MGVQVPNLKNQPKHLKYQNQNLNSKIKEKPLKSYGCHYALRTIKINRNKANIKMPSPKKLIKLNNNIIMYIKNKKIKTYNKRKDLWLGCYSTIEE